jgi:hypothetical protein
MIHWRESRLRGVSGRLAGEGGIDSGSSVGRVKRYTSEALQKRV